MAVQEINTIREMQATADTLRAAGKRIGVVPTMGYLHEGHGSLIEAACRENDVVIVTIFVNPLQFAAHEDLSTYPRNFKRDVEIIGAMGGAIVFAPVVGEMYPAGFETKISIGGSTEKFEGAFRPSHFDGVATVVAKLFMATKPHSAYFGQKDYQQVAVIRQLLRDLNIDIALSVQPTVREEDGLAKSSRNVYLSADDRARAVVLSQALRAALAMAQAGERQRDVLNTCLRNVLETVPDLRIDYAAAAHADTLAEPDTFKEDDEIVMLIAVRLGTTRLIDNMVFRPS
ncbi:MAG: pantoate--beta-alanine ligase [Candidatus Kapaibacterium sp.]